MHQSRRSPLSCNSWIWATSWFTIEGFSFCCMESSPSFNCRALSASTEQNVCNSSISWQSLARSSWQAVFLMSNSIHAVGLIHKEPYQHFVFPILFCPIQLALQISSSEPHTLLEKVDQLFVSRNSWRLRSTDRILSFSIWEGCTLSNSRFRLPFNNVLSKLENDATSRTGLPMLENKSVSTRNTEWDLHSLRAPEKTVVQSTVPRLSCRLFQTQPPWGSCRESLFSKESSPECARCWLRWETWAHNLWEETVRPSGQRATLRAEGQWLNSSEV